MKILTLLIICRDRYEKEMFKYLIEAVILNFKKTTSESGNDV